MYHFILQLNKMPVEKLKPKDGFQELISEVEELKSKISKPVGKIAEWLGKLWEKQKERLEKKSLNFLEAKKTIRSDYGKFFTENDLVEIERKLDSKREEVNNCFEKYKELNEPNLKFLPFLLGYLWYNSLKDKNDYLAVVDFSMDAESNRLFLINMKSNKVEINTTCMQWEWKNWVQTFSNENDSWQTSLGLVQVPVNRERSKKNKRWVKWYLWDEEYWWVQPYKKEDKKLMLCWLEPGFNDNTYARHIYMHTWDRSKGCFTLPQNKEWNDVLRKMAFWGVGEAFYPGEYVKDTLLLG